MKRDLRKLVAVAVILMMALALAACGAPDVAEPITVEDGAVVGEGAVTFDVEITDADGNVVNVTVNTDEETVGGALASLGLVAGDETQYGLYVKTVNGITYDYDIDGKYWAFYVDGAYATVGIDMTEITAGAKYSIKAE